MNPRLVILTLLLLLAAFAPARATQYFTLEAARALMFPGADTFEYHVVKFTGEQKAAIEKTCGERLKNLGNRVWVARRAGELLGLFVLDHVLGKHELIDYAVALTPDGRVKQVEVLNYRESHGHEIRRDSWRRQFAGKDATAPLRLNQDIDNLSGATISCRNVADGIKRVLASFEPAFRSLLTVK